MEKNRNTKIILVATIFQGLPVPMPKMIFFLKKKDETQYHNI